MRQPHRSTRSAAPGASPASLALARVVDRPAHRRPQPRRDVSARCGNYARLGRLGRRHHQPGRALLRGRRRRGHRLQDEPVQHRRRRPVPAGGAARRGRRRRRRRCPAPLHVLFILARRHGRRRRLGRRSPASSRSTRGVNEVVSTIMLNFIATGIIGVPARRVLPERRAPAWSRRPKPLPPFGLAPAAEPPARGRSATTCRAGTMLQGFLARRHPRRDRLLRRRLTAPGSASTCAPPASTRRRPARRASTPSG